MKHRSVLSVVIVSCLLALRPALARENTGGDRAAAKPGVPDGVKVSIAQAANTRGFGNGKEIFYTNVTLDVRGTGLAEAKATRTVVKEAKGEDGIDLLPKDKTRFSDRFSAITQLFGQKPSTQRYTGFMLESPGKANTITLLAGAIELVVPAKDPASVVTGVAKDVGAPLKNAALKAAGAEITLKEIRGAPKGANPPKSWEVVYEIKDPKGKVVVNPEFFDGSGRKLTTNGVSGGGSGGNVTMTTMFKTKPPDDFVVKFYLITDLSVVTVPFEFKDVPVKQ